MSLVIDYRFEVPDHSFYDEECHQERHHCFHVSGVTIRPTHDDQRILDS